MHSHATERVSPPTLHMSPRSECCYCAAQSRHGAMPCFLASLLARYCRLCIHINASVSQRSICRISFHSVVLAMAQTTDHADAVEVFLFCSGVDLAELKGLQSSDRLRGLFASTAEFQLFRRTMHIPGARTRSLASLTEFRQTAHAMRERRLRHVTRQSANLAAAVPALRGRERLVRHIISFTVGRSVLQAPTAATVCVCVAHGCQHRTVGVESFVQHVRTAHAAAHSSSASAATT